MMAAPGDADERQVRTRLLAVVRKSAHKMRAPNAEPWRRHCRAQTVGPFVD